MEKMLEKGKFKVTLRFLILKRKKSVLRLIHKREEDICGIELN